MDGASDRLQTARRAAGYADATAAARAFNWNKNTYRSHENNIRGLKPNVAERYAKAFRVAVGWLLTGDGVGPATSVDAKPRTTMVDLADLRAIVALLLRTQGTEAQLAGDLADTVVDCLSSPPLSAVGGDLVKSAEVRLELQARLHERPTSR